MQFETVNADEVLKVAVIEDPDGQAYMELTVEGGAVLRLHPYQALIHLAKVFGACLALRNELTTYERQEISAGPEDVARMDAWLQVATLTASSTAAEEYLKQLLAQHKPEGPTDANKASD